MLTHLDSKGPQYLKQLAELEQKQTAVAGGTPDQWIRSRIEAKDANDMAISPI